jgi:hypothetical protein
MAWPETITVLDSDGVEREIPVPVGVGRASEALSKSIAIDTETKAVFDDMADIQAASALQRGTLADTPYSGTGTPESELAMEIAVAQALLEDGPAQVVGASVVKSAAPTVSTTAYTSGDCIGGKLTFTGMARANGLTGLVQTAMIQCKSAQTFAADLIIFHTDPSSTTFTDNSALSVNAADFDKVALRIPFVAGDWSSLGTPSIAEVSAQGKLYQAAASSQDLYGVLVARGTPTLASTSDIKVVLKALLD